MEASGVTLSEQDVRALKGEALDDALDQRQLPKVGTADEKRDRLLESLSAAGALAPPPAEQSGTASPAEGRGSGTVTLRTRYPVDRFEHGIAGAPSITSAGTEVPASKVDALNEAAKSADTHLEEVS